MGDLAILVEAHAVMSAKLTRVMAMRRIRRIQKFIEIVACSPGLHFALNSQSIAV